LLEISADNFTNPFNLSTKISYSIPSSEYVTLKIYDIIGSVMALLVNQTVDYLSLQWRNQCNSTVSIADRLR